MPCLALPNTSHFCIKGPFSLICQFKKTNYDEKRDGAVYATDEEAELGSRRLNEGRFCAIQCILFKPAVKKWVAFSGHVL